MEAPVPHLVDGLGVQYSGQESLLLSGNAVQWLELRLHNSEYLGTSVLLCSSDPQEKKNSMSPFHEDNLVQVIVDLFLAGTDKIAVSLSWALFFMGVHPNVQGENSLW